MTEYAPKAIQSLFSSIHAKMPHAVLSGIVGDHAHTYGYHRCRNVLPGNDYSVVLPRDHNGDGWAASALDISFNPTDMKLVTARLIKAAKAHDGRLKGVREFCGTTNGTVTHNFDLATGHEGFGEWDDSHLWHVHLSFYRDSATNTSALAPIADVIAGVGSPTTGGKPVIHHAAPAFPLPAGHYFGLISGPVNCHGGFHASDRAYIRRIQQRLQALGYAPKSAGWADGIFGKPTHDAVAKWQRAKYARSTSRFGEVWADDWRHLFA